MAEIVVLGAGITGLTTAMLIAGDGHQVTVLERDPAPPPASPYDAWDEWERRGVNQFRLLHYFQPRFRAVAEAELPAVVAALDRAGALRFNPLAEVPDQFTGGWREGDSEFETITGRRPVVEAAFAAVADATPGVTVRRGLAVEGLLTGADATAGVPHVSGVRTDTGEHLTADLVVDATGRRSPLPAWLAALGSAGPTEELEDSGFVYYGRHFHSDGATPAIIGPLLQDYGTISVLTLPADNGTWGVGIVTSARDRAMRGLRDADRWSATVRSLPLAAHWLDGKPLEDQVSVMAKIEDRHRSYVVDGRPVATGVLSVGDSWACTNPSLGRGATMDLLHAVALRDTLREIGLDHPVGLATAWDAATMDTVEPWYRATLTYDRHRLAEIAAAIDGESYEGDLTWQMTRGLIYAAGQHPDCLRAFLSIAGLLRTTEDVFDDPHIFETVVTLGASWQQAPVLGPSRDELLSIATA